MTLVRPRDLEHLRAALGSASGPRAVLVFGNDVGGVREVADGLARVVLGEAADDPLAVETLHEARLAEDPARLVDEAQAISMFGARRVVRVREAGAAFLEAVKLVLALPTVEAPIIAEAPGLRKDTALARLFTREKALAAVPVYDDDARSLHALVDEVMRANGLVLEPDARQALVQLLGGDRAASRGELEKLALYCMGRRRVRLEDVRAVCSDASAHRMQDMLDAFFAGDVARGAGLLLGLREEGMESGAMLAAAASFIGRLTEMALLVADGATVREAMKKGQVFFRREPLARRQLAFWTPQRLARADESVRQAMLQARQVVALQHEIAERCLMSIGMQAARRRTA